VNRYDEAIADYSKLIELDDKDDEAYRLRAITYAVKHDNDAALADSKKAIELTKQKTEVQGQRTE
jgi:tetratricopeptide (TPR) repeat protein